MLEKTKETEKKDRVTTEHETNIETSYIICPFCGTINIFTPRSTYFKSISVCEHYNDMFRSSGKMLFRQEKYMEIRKSSIIKIKLLDERIKSN